MLTSNFINNDSICSCINPVTYNEDKSNLFLKACQETINHHFKNSEIIRYIYKRKNFHPDDLVTIDDLHKIPFINVHAMKHHLLLSGVEKDAVLKMTSSGTGGQKTQIWMNQESLDRGQKMLLELWREENLISDKKTNYLLFVYNPKQANDLGVSFSANNRMRFAPINKYHYAINKNQSGQWDFNKDKTIEILHEYIKENKPVRLLGITGFLFEFIEKLEQIGGVQLPENSYVFTSGGWKKAEEKRISRSQFTKRMADCLNIPSENIRDGYGLAEHGAPYWQCKHHKLHIPCFSRVIIRNPITMEVEKNGNVGNIQLITPFNTMMPTVSLLTTDLGLIHPDPCSCGKNSPTFQIEGRGGVNKHKGCAISANELVTRS